MSDLISRQAAIDAVHEEFDECLVWDESGLRTADEVERILDKLPSVEGRRRKGTWRDTGSGQECSVCKEIQYGYDSGRYFCANCGADMRGRNE